VIAVSCWRPHDCHVRLDECPSLCWGAKAIIESAGDRNDMHKVRGPTIRVGNNRDQDNPSH